MRASPRSLALALALSLSGGGLAHALPAEEPAASGMVNGKVRTLAQVGPLIWAGGTFTHMQNAAGANVRAVSGLAAFDAATGAPALAAAIPAVTKSSGAAVVYDLALAPDGVTLYLAGSFTHVGGQARKNVAAIDTSTGAVLGFNPATAIAYSVLATEGAIFVGTKKLQSFWLDGTPSAGFMAPTAIVDPTLRAHSTQALFRDLAVDGSAIVAACHCDALIDVNGSRATKAAVKIDVSTGEWLSWSPSNLNAGSSATGISLALGIDPSTSAPTLYLGAGGSDFVAAYDLVDGQQQWKTDTSGSAQSVATHDGAVLVGGHYQYIEAPDSVASCGDAVNPDPNGDCSFAPRLNAIDPASGDVLVGDGGGPWNPGVCCKYNGIWAVLPHADGERVSVGGEFTKLGGTWSDGSGTWTLSGFQRQNNFGLLPPPPDPSLTVHRAGGGSGVVTSAPPGIDCGATCSASYLEGTEVVLQATPDENSTFAGWSGACTGVGACTVTLSSSTAVTATFDEIVRTLTITRAGGGDGTVTSDPAGIDCGVDCDESLVQGTSVILTASPAEGSAFAGWAGSCAGQDATCDLVVTGDLANEASFELAVPLDVQLAGPGVGRVTSEPAGIDCGPTCAGGFAPGATVVVTADPDVASTFEGFGGACSGTDPCEVQMSEARSVVASFGHASGCGRILFTSTRDGNDEIYVMRPDGSQVTRLTTNAANDRDPAWSPDCSQIAFSSSRIGNPEIWVMAADGSGATRLTSATGADSDPSWSPDGSQIAFVSGRTGNSEIFTMTSTGAAQTNRTANGANDRAPDWSPDGSLLAFSSNRTGTFQVFTMPSGGGTVTRLTFGLGGCDAPSWSPDGSRLAMTSTSSGTPQVWTIAPDGMAAVPLTSGGAVDSHPTWAPDGESVAFGSTMSGASRVWFVSSEGTGASMVSDEFGGDSAPAWS